MAALGFSSFTVVKIGINNYTDRLDFADQETFFAPWIWIHPSAMRFLLIDRIIDLQPGARIETVKCLSLAEEYLADHFPRAPVMPGVLMLEALTQSCAWLVRASEDFAHSVVLLKEARSVKYASFVEPGKLLQITAEIQSQDQRFTKFKAQGTIDDTVAVSARLTLERYNLADGQPGSAMTDRYLTARMREFFGILYPREPAAA